MQWELQISCLLFCFFMTSQDVGLNTRKIMVCCEAQGKCYRLHVEHLDKNAFHVYVRFRVQAVKDFTRKGAPEIMEHLKNKITNTFPDFT